MIAEIDLPDFARDLQAHSHELSEQIGAALGDLGATLVAKAGENLLALDPPATVWIRDGLFRFRCEGKMARLYGPGDMLHTGPREGLGHCDLVSPFAARITVFERSALVRGLAGKPGLIEKWLELQAIDERILQVLAAARAREDLQPEFDSQLREPGDVMVREGQCTEQIFELIDGHAVVSAGGVVVGDVHAGEIFGEIGFLTAEPCTATVIADEVCTVSGVSREDFERLIQSRPQMMMDLATTLARRVSNLTKKLVPIG